jgi:hypothetical protein
MKSKVLLSYSYVVGNSVDRKDTYMGYILYKEEGGNRWVGGGGAH